MNDSNRENTSGTGTDTAARRLRTVAALAGLVLLLAGCGGGAETETLPEINPPAVAEYSGPPPATADVQSFKINVWDNLKGTNRCGGCHVSGGQTPAFVRNDDVNLAYAEANTVANLSVPDESRLVTKVGGGHHCWLTSAAACADILTTWVTAWAGDAVAGGGNEIDLQAPVIRDVGVSRNFPDDPGFFAATVHPVLIEYCAACHASAATIPQQPYFAEPDAFAAYEAAKSKIDLDEPEASRLVIRLGNEFHNCWSDCDLNAAEMASAVAAMAGQITPTQVDPALVTSKALTLFEGTIASGGNRYDANAIANYEFKTGTGSTAFDTSGVEPAMNLTLSGDTGWVGGWGIRISDGKAQASTASSRKLHDLIKATGEFSIEAWVVPGNVTQEDTRIVSYSAGTEARNFNLGQTLYNYDFSTRSSVTDANGAPALSTADADEDLQATLQHVVATYDPVNGRQIFVNGEFTGDADGPGGSLVDWDDTFALVLGNEVSGTRQWAGILRQVVIHNRALSDTQIVQNFAAGVGEKFFLLFSVSDMVDVPESYILFEVSQFDSYSYLFNAPRFISLDAGADPDGIPVAGMRIGINGAEAQIGQAYGNLDTRIARSDFVEGSQPLSPLGTIVGLQKGPQEDEFFLTFEILGDNMNVITEAAPLQPADPADVERDSDIGLRTFDEINATMATVTGVSANDPAVKQTYDTIRQQLPTLEALGGFLSSHQVAVAQLAIEYCNSLVDDNGMRSAFFPGFDFDRSAGQAFATAADRDVMLDPLMDHVLGTNVGSQPDSASVKAELNSLIDRLTVCGSGCDADRTATVVKAVCAGAIGSAATLIQ